MPQASGQRISIKNKRLGSCNATGSDSLCAGDQRLYRRCEFLQQVSYWPSASASFLRSVERLMPSSFAAATWLPSVAFSAALTIS